MSDIIYQTNLYAVPYVADVMSIDRFGQILSHLHVNDNTAVPNNNKDKLFKIRPIITKLNSNYMKLYNVRKAVSFDESMIYSRDDSQSSSTTQ